MARLFITLSAIILLCFILGACFYPFLPERMAIHWSGGPEPDGYMDKFWGTFLMPVIFIFALTAFMVPVFLFDALDSKVFSRWYKSISMAMGLFLLYAYVLVLMYNVGAAIDIPKMLTYGGVVFVAFTIISLCFASVRGKSVVRDKTPHEPIIENNAATYSDKLIEITEQGILFRYYYFPFGNKYVQFEQIDFIGALEPTARNGLFRFHGTGDFRTWFPADYGRAGRDRIFLMHLKNKWRRIGFTAESSWTVKSILQQHSLLKTS